MLMPDDFKAYSKVKIDNHLFNKSVIFTYIMKPHFFFTLFHVLLRENMPSHFKFKEWCPLVFKNLRERFGVDDETYMVWFLQNPFYFLKL